MEVRVLSSALHAASGRRSCFERPLTYGVLGPFGTCVLRLESDNSVDLVHSVSSYSSHTRVLSSAPFGYG